MRWWLREEWKTVGEQEPLTLISFQWVLFSLRFVVFFCRRGFLDNNQEGFHLYSFWWWMRFRCMSCVVEKYKSGKSSSDQSLMSSAEWVLSRFITQHQLDSNFWRHQKNLFRIMSTEVSASELSYLKAQVWSLQNVLRQEKANLKNLTVSWIR